MTPTPTATASSRPTAGCSTRTTISRWRSSTCTPTGRNGRRRRPSARPRSARRSSTGWSAGLGRKLLEVPVGFKWFVDGLISGTIGFGGEESAGASFLRTDGTTWTTDKDGIILALLASEILAVTGTSPSQRYEALAEKYGAPTYARIDAPADRDQKARLAKLSPEQVTATELAGEEITAKLTTAPGNGAPLGGLKVTTENAWFAARPSGTEDVYKIYAESFKGPEHLAEVQEAAREVVNKVIA